MAANRNQVIVFSQAQHRADAYEFPVRRQDPLGQALQITIGQRQKTLPDAWRCAGIRCPEGQ